MTPNEALQQAVQHHQAGRLAQAEAFYRQVLESSPDNPDALHLLGVIASQCGHHDEAIDLISQAIRRSGRNTEYHLNLGLAHNAAAHWDQAIEAFGATIALQPRHAAAWAAMGDALYEAHRIDEAAGACRKAIMFQPNLPEGHQILGKCLHAKGDRDGAIACFRKALTFRPDYAVALNNLGQTLSETGHWREAIDCCRRSVALNPNYSQAQWNLSLMLLRQGDFETGWPGYESRWRHPTLQMTQPYPHPWWDGSALNGKRILLHAEQGLGDAIQFVRYIPLVLRRGGKIIGACQEPLARLFASIPGVEQWLTPGDFLPEVDVQCPLMSLPSVFKTTLASIPAKIPYLSPDADRTASWRDRLKDHTARKMGLVWANKPNPPDRCPPAQMLGALAAVSGIQFISLQKWLPDMTRSAPPLDLIDWTDELNDFADTAALIANLDLILSVDTAVAHLAGAMGKPVWVMLKFEADWRWLMNQTDSPWYPTMRLFRQTTLGEWKTPIAQIVQALGADR